MAPAKKINLRVTYNDISHVIECGHHEVINNISSRFKINMKDVILYSIEKDRKVRISPNNITDLMKIEIVPKRNGQTPIHASVEPKSEKILDDVISKLRQNMTLTGRERQLLIAALETHKTDLLKKRKLDQTDIPKPIVHHKKMQVDIPSHSKDSFTQTDTSNISYNHIETPKNVKENHMQTLKMLWNLEKEERPHEDIKLLMKETYDERRRYICLSAPPVIEVREKYPALFCVEQVKEELDRIFYPGKCEEFLTNMSIYTKHILYYKEDDKVKEIFDKIEKARNRAHTQVQKTYAEVVGSIFVLTRLLEEDFGFIHLSDYPHSSEDIFPFIDASIYSLQKIFFDDVLFHIKVEGQYLCEASNFPEAMLCLMACFFIFNIDYPKSCRCTFTIIEKVFLKANDTLEMDVKTEQWIKLLTLKEKSKA